MKDVYTDALQPITSSVLCLVRWNSAGGCFGSSAALIGGRSSRGAAGAVFSDTRGPVVCPVVF